MNLSWRLRPESLDDFVGQEHLTGKGKIIRRMMENDLLFPIIFWGPPGTGKTTLAFIIASEDIGLADRGALIQANAAFEAVTKVGMPEAQLILAHCCLYLSTAKKSRDAANALGRAKEAVYEFPNEPVPLHLRNAPTKLMKNLGYAGGYQWSDSYVGTTQNQSYLPEKLKDRKFFQPLK